MPVIPLQINVNIDSLRKIISVQSSCLQGDLTLWSYLHIFGSVTHFAGLHSFHIYINEGQSFGKHVTPKAPFSWQNRGNGCHWRCTRVSETCREGWLGWQSLRKNCVLLHWQRETRPVPSSISNAFTYPSLGKDASETYRENVVEVTQAGPQTHKK